MYYFGVCVCSSLHCFVENLFSIATISVDKQMFFQPQTADNFGLDMPEKLPIDVTCDGFSTTQGGVSQVK